MEYTIQLITQILELKEQAKYSEQDIKHFFQCLIENKQKQLKALETLECAA